MNIARTIHNLKLNLRIFLLLKSNRWNDSSICCIYFLNDVVLGIVGDWEDHFTTDQSERFDAEYAQKMAGTDIPFQYHI